MEEAIYDLFLNVIKGLPIEIKTIFYAILISFYGEKTDNAYFWNANITSVNVPIEKAFRFVDDPNINTLVGFMKRERRIL